MRLCVVSCSRVLMQIFVAIYVQIHIHTLRIYGEIITCTIPPINKTVITRQVSVVVGSFSDILAFIYFALDRYGSQGLRWQTGHVGH